MASSSDSWMKEYNEATKLADDINGMISERSTLPASGPDAQRYVSAIRRKNTILGTRLDSLQSLLSKLPGKQPISEKELNRRKDMIGTLRSKVLQMASTLTSHTANRDSLLGPEINKADPMGRTVGLDNYGLVGLQRQVMKEQDEGLEKLEETVVSTKHIALAVNEELDLHARLIDDLDQHVEVTDSRLRGDNVSVSSINLEKIFSMKGGKGELSYGNNSQAQAKHASSMLHLLKETLDRMQLSSPEVPFVVADLGCSSGSNSINTVDAIIKHMAKRYDALGYDSPEFSAFFSDLPSTDFNTLFQLLPPLGNHGGSMEEALATDSHRSYFAAGVPGSFYRRLFPSRSIDLFHSAFSLHWLSQVPESVLDKRSAAYNKGRVFIHGANESTANAYKKQFQTDLASFLRSRAMELKKGGSMFLVCLGRTSVEPTDQSGLGLLLGTHIQGAWDDLVQEGLITSEKRDSFNYPVYASSLQDFKEVVEADGSFTINKLEIFNGGSPLVVNQPDDAAEVGRALANSCRSAGGVLIDAHIGEHLGNELFSRVEQRGSRHAKEILEQIQFLYIVASLSLA